MIIEDDVGFARQIKTAIIMEKHRVFGRRPTPFVDHGQRTILAKINPYSKPYFASRHVRVSYRSDNVRGLRRFNDETCATNAKAQQYDTCTTRSVTILFLFSIKTRRVFVATKFYGLYAICGFRNAECRTRASVVLIYHGHFPPSPPFAVYLRPS